MGRRPTVPRTQLLMMYHSLLRRLGSARSFHRRRGRRPRPEYDAPSTLRTLRALWEQWEGPTPWGPDGGEVSLEVKPKRAFPEHQLRTMLATKCRPRDLALLVLATWFGVEGETILRYITRFRRAIPQNVRAALNL